MRKYISQLNLIVQKHLIHYCVASMDSKVLLIFLALIYVVSTSEIEKQGKTILLHSYICTRYNNNI